MQSQHTDAGRQKSPPEDRGAVERRSLLDREEQSADRRSKGRRHSSCSADGREVSVIDVVSEVVPDSAFDFESDFVFEERRECA